MEWNGDKLKENIIRSIEGYYADSTDTRYVHYEIGVSRRFTFLLLNIDY